MRTVKSLVTIAKIGYDHAGWYDDMENQLRAYCMTRGWDYDVFIDIMAITSPRIHVTRNIRVAAELMATGVMPKSIIRSVHASYANYIDGKGIAGVKTSAFAAALKGDNDAIVLDVYMARAANIPQKWLSDRKTVHAELCRRIRKVGKIVGLTPRDCQAAIWGGQRHLEGWNPSKPNVRKILA
jgi:hypothetical protein